MKQSVEALADAAIEVGFPEPIHELFEHLRACGCVTLCEQCLSYLKMLDRAIDSARAA